MLLAPKNTRKVNETSSRLSQKDDPLKLVGAIYVFNAEHRSNCGQIFSQLKSISFNSDSPETKLEEFRQMKVVLRVVNVTAR